MTMRKIWLWVLTLAAVVSIGINALILTGLTDRHFKDYLAENYDAHIRQIQDYVRTAMISNEVSYRQMAIELETHLDDPIIKIKIYRPDGQLLVAVSDDSYLRAPAPHGRMMRDFMNNSTEAVDQYPVTEGDRTIAYLNVTRHSAVENSVVAQLFKGTLIMNSLVSIVIALGFSIVVGTYVSKRMSRDLRETAQMASDLHLGTEPVYKPSNIVEIKQIRDSLDELGVRLRLKEKSRKALLDQLIHQYRTPMTILKTHLEALEDGVITMNKEELDVFNHQLAALSSLMENLGNLIEAERVLEKPVPETFECHAYMKQILLGLQAQFDQKGIALRLNSSDKVKLTTDKHMLSQIVYNLLTNAYKYTETGGQVDVSYAAAGDYLRLTVNDTGRGIGEGAVERIFDAYFRGENATDVAGEGIGLYMVKLLLNQLDGSVTVDSELGKGSRFEVMLPLVLDETNAGENTAAGKE